MHSEGRYGLERGCAGRWLLQSDAVDTIGTNDGTLNDGASIGTAGGRACLVLDGTDDYLSIPDSATIDFGTGNFTAAFWLRTSTVSKPVFDKYTSGQGQVQCAMNGSGQMYLYTYRTAEHYRFSSASVATGDWVHFAGVRAGSAIDIYVNGVLSNGTAVGSTAQDVDSTAALTIGKYSLVSQYFNGSINMFRLYNRALSAAEVARLARIY